ncbi:LOB domain-containing protein 30-like [Andrographis paniculata]|uniref:LOB domain-containing protein 30-like n=1 Tax=Andrographis paniculata TaxID=175694 RepID=UPI0021E7302C|nr:LOB domain-containing protein 30-like [Andrographis paniculata]
MSSSSSSVNMAANGGGGGGRGPCGACKFLRRKCVAGCVFSPYFDSEEGAAHFAAVHKVFGASNVSKLLHHIPAGKRLDAAVTICYEAQSRLRDPIYGCVGHIFALQQQVVNLQAELSCLQAYLAALEIPAPAPATVIQPGNSISEFPAIPASSVNDHLSALCDSGVYPSWTIHQRLQDPRPPASADSPLAGAGGGDLQELARELLNRHVTPVGSCRNQASVHVPPRSRGSN